METRYAWNPKDVKHYTTEELRREFLIENLFETGKINMVYSHVDRIIAGGATPSGTPLQLECDKSQLGVDYFLERRELGVINIGGKGKITLDGVVYEMNPRDGMYVGMGTKEVVFESEDASAPAKFYFNSAPAHTTYETVKIDISKARPNPLGTDEACNKRTIYQFVHPNVCKSCQLLMGMTVLEPGSIWNTMPCHTHDRRMEVYLYFDLSPEDVVFHFMGEPNETRHLVMKNEQAAICPSWSIHSGCATKNYTFIWGMVGENQEFTDMDNIKTTDLQ